MTSTFCDPCSCRKSKVLATNYCHICRESFCEQCSDVHQASKATKAHLLINASDEFVFSTFNQELERLQTCSIHNKPFEFFCGNHESFNCGMCLAFSNIHNECSRLVDISMVGGKLVESGFTDTVSNEMSNVITKTDQATIKLRNELAKSEKSKNNMSEQLNQFVDSLQNLLDVVKEQVAQIKEMTSAQYQNHEKKCKYTLETLEAFKRSAQRCDTFSRLIAVTGNPADTFRSAFVINNELQKIASAVNGVNDDISVIKVVVEKSDIIDRLQECNKPLFRCKTSTVDVHLKPLVMRGDLTKAMDKAMSDSIKSRLSSTALESVIAPGYVSQKMTEFDNIQNEENEKLVCSKTDISKGPKRHNPPVTDMSGEIHTPMNETEENPVKCTKESKSHTDGVEQFPGKCLADKENHTSPSKSKNPFKANPDNTNDGTDIEKPKGNSKHRDKECTTGNKQNEDLIQTKYNTSFNVVSASETLAPPKFVGMLVLHNGRIVLSDPQNARLLVLNSTGDVLNELFTPFLPKCLANISKARFAVSILKDGRIAFVKIKSLSKLDVTYISTRYHTKSMASVSTEKLLVTMMDRDKIWHMDVMHVNGTILQTIDLQGFYDGYNVAVQQLDDGDNFSIIYGSSLYDKLRCCEANGKFVFDYNAPGLSSVITDSHGYVYIVKYNGEIEILTPNGALKERDKYDLLVKPKCAAFDMSGDKLYITASQSTQIHVIDIKRSFNDQ